MDFSTTLQDARPQSPAPTKRILPGQCFCDRYRVVRALGRGGFGVTFLARDIRLPSHPLCVIKLLHPKATHPEVLARARERFEREAKTLSQLGSHSQVPRLLDYFEQEGDFYLVQEYVPGHTLAKEVRQNGPLSELAVKRFVREILPVLSYLHQNQVIHRDIKPPNIIRCADDGRLVLIDFGAVKEQLIGLEETTCYAPATQFVGTVGFAPPEQLALRPTYATDIFALGITCLFLLTGKAPMEMDYDLDTGEIRWEQEVEVSPYFARVLTKMIKPSLQERYQTVEQVMRAMDLEPYLDRLASCMHNQPLSAPAESERPVVEQRRSPFAKTAEEIRKWRRQLIRRQHRQNWERQNWVTQELASSSWI